MVLPAPNLDDRRFQDLVDDAKRLVQQRCPEWTDHNVSDPGVTLIEAFAQMVDQLIYRLNRVPGPQLHQVPGTDRGRAPTAGGGRGERSPSGCRRRSRRPWSSAGRPRWPLPEPMSPIRWSSPPSRTWTSCRAPSTAAGAMSAGGEAVDHSTALRAGGEFECFQRSPQPGDALLIGLSERGAVLRRRASGWIAGSGVSASTGLAAADLGGLDRHRLDGLRSRPGRDRRDEQGR